MADFNWNDHPIVAKSDEFAPKDDKGTDASAEKNVESKGKDASKAFSWDDHPIVEHKKQEEISAGRAGLVGAGQGATFGFADELTAPVVAAGSMVHDAFSKPENQVTPTLPGGESTWDKYSRLMQNYRDVARDEQKQAQAQQPAAYTGGAVAGGLLTMKAPGMGAIGTGLGKAGQALPGAGRAMEMAPGLTKFFGNVAKGGIEGTGYGAVAGLGEGEGDLSQRAQSAEEMAKTGGLVGAAIPVAGQALKSTGKLASAVGDLPIVNKMTKNFKQGAAGNDLVTASGRKSAFNALDEQSGNLLGDAKEMTKDVGNQIGEKIQAATDAGEKVNLTDQYNQVMEKLKNIKANGSKESAANAAAIETEINKVLGIKAPKAPEGLSGIEAPEGLNMDLINKPQAPAEPTQVIIDPKKAQDLKQVLQDFSPKKGVTTPQQLESARAAGEVKGAAAEKINEVTGVNEPVKEGGTSLNEQYGGLKDSLKLLRAQDGSKLPEQMQQNLTNTLAKADNGTLSGDQARKQVDKLLTEMEQVNPELANKYRQPLNDAIERFQMASDNKLTYRGPIGTIVHAAPAVANAAGLVANKTGATALAKPISAAANAAKSFTNTVLNEQAGRVGQTATEGAVPVTRAATQPYQLQRQVASASEKTDPETLKSQASQIRSQYGQTGERLATQLENMAGKNRDARRALMFTILQDPNSRKMLGLANEEKQQ